MMSSRWYISYRSASESVLFRFFIGEALIYQTLLLQSRILGAAVWVSLLLLYIFLIIEDDARGERGFAGIVDEFIHAFQLFSRVAIDQIEVFLGTATHYLMHEAVVVLMVFALYHGQISEISAIEALMCVFRHLIAIGHQSPLSAHEFLHLFSGFAFIPPDAFEDVPHLELRL